MCVCLNKNNSEDDDEVLETKKCRCTYMCWEAGCIMLRHAIHVLNGPLYLTYAGWESASGKVVRCVLDWWRWRWLWRRWRWWWQVDTL